MNRSILASGWSQLERKLAYPCGRAVKVPAAYTSQTCSQCGGVDPRNRPAQARFQCIDCGFEINADHNAALNILGHHVHPVARGTGAAARRGAFPFGTPATREQDMFRVSVLRYISPSSKV